MGNLIASLNVMLRVALIPRGLINDGDDGGDSGDGGDGGDVKL